MTTTTEGNFNAHTWAWTQRIPAGPRVVLTVLADRVGQNKELKCWPSLARIAEDAAMSVRSVSNHLALLEAAGYISRTGRGARSTWYYLTPHLADSAKIIAQILPDHHADFADRTTTGTTPEEETSEVLRTSSGREPRSTRKVQPAVQEIEPLGSGIDAEEERPRRPPTRNARTPAPDSGLGLAWYFRDHVRVPWGEQNLPALAKQLGTWLPDIPPDRIRLMIDWYADDVDGSPARPKAPWKDFVARRAFIFAQTETMSSHREQEAHASDPLYWTGKTGDEYIPASERHKKEGDPK